MSIMEFIILYVSVGFVGLLAGNAVYIEKQLNWYEKYGNVPSVAHFHPRNRFMALKNVILGSLFYPVWLGMVAVKLIMASRQLHH